LLNAVTMGMSRVLTVVVFAAAAFGQVSYKGYTSADCTGVPVITMGGPAGACLKFGVEQSLFTATTQYDTGLHFEVTCMGTVKVFENLQSYQQMPIFRKDGFCKADSAKLSDTYQPW
jgi:hypothetical protein